MQYISRSSPEGDTFSARANGVIVSSNSVSGVKWTDTWKLAAPEVVLPVGLIFYRAFKEKLGRPQGHVRWQTH